MALGPCLRPTTLKNKIYFGLGFPVCQSIMIGKVKERGVNKLWQTGNKEGKTGRNWERKKKIIWDVSTLCLFNLYFIACLESFLCINIFSKKHITSLLIGITLNLGVNIDNMTSNVLKTINSCCLWIWKVLQDSRIYFNYFLFSGSHWMHT